MYSIYVLDPLDLWAAGVRPVRRAGACWLATLVPLGQRAGACGQSVDLPRLPLRAGSFCLVLGAGCRGGSPRDSTMIARDARAALLRELCA